MFCRLDDLNNEAAVETFLINRLLTRLGYPDSRIRTKEAIQALPIPRGECYGELSARLRLARFREQSGNSHRREASR